MNKCDVRKQLIKYQENLEYINKLIKTSEVVTPTMYKQKKEIEIKIKEVKEKMEQMEKPNKPDKPNTQYNLNGVNNYLFEELERLNDEEALKLDDNFNKEIKRAKAISDLCSTIISNANLILSAKKYADEIGEKNENEVLQLKEK